jgi:hypothetical protein
VRRQDPCTNRPLHVPFTPLEPSASTMPTASLATVRGKHVHSTQPRSARPCVAPRSVTPIIYHLLMHRLPRACLGLSNRGHCALRACARRCVAMPALPLCAAQHLDARGQPLLTKFPRASLLADAYHACAALAPSHLVTCVWAAYTAATWRAPSAVWPPLQGVTAMSPRTHV